MIQNIEANYKSAETTELTTRWKEIGKPGIYRKTGGRWKRYHEPKFLRNEKKVIEERLQQLTNNWPQEDLRQKIGPQNKGGFQLQTGHSEQWTVDPFWGWPTGQPQFNNTNLTDPDHHPHRSPWKRVKSTRKRTTTPRS